MRLPPFQYLSPGTVKEALETIGGLGHKVRVVAGGTDIVNRLRERLVTPSFVMSLKGIPDLKGIKKGKTALVISTGTTLSEMEESPEVSTLFPTLVKAASLVAAPPVRNIATIGGNILQETRCLFYDQSEVTRKAAPACLKEGGKVCAAVKGATRCLSVYQGDLSTVLIAFDANVVLKKAGSKRTFPVSDLFTGKGKAPFSIGDDELLTEVLIPVPKGHYACAYHKLRLRSSLDYPIASAAAFISVKDGVIDKARVVAGASGPAPCLVNTSKFLVGRTLADADPEGASDAAMRASKAVDNLSLPASYRRKMVKVMAKRAMDEALRNLGEGA